MLTENTRDINLNFKVSKLDFAYENNMEIEITYCSILKTISQRRADMFTAIDLN